MITYATCQDNLAQQLAIPFKHFYFIFEAQYLQQVITFLLVTWSSGRGCCMPSRGIARLHSTSLPSMTCGLDLRHSSRTSDDANVTNPKPRDLQCHTS